MISFKQFLFENPNYPLFHGLSLRSLIDVIEHNTLMHGGYSDSHYQHDQLRNKKTISFTRSKNFATYWSQRKQWATDTMRDADRKSSYPSAVIQLNRGKLKSNYKIIPYNHFVFSGTRQIDSKKWIGGEPVDRKHQELDRNQYEERIIGSVKNIDKYIEKVYLSKDALDHIKNLEPEIYKKMIDRGWV